MLSELIDLCYDWRDNFAIIISNYVLRDANKLCCLDSTFQLRREYMREMDIGCSEVLSKACGLLNTMICELRIARSGTMRCVNNS